MTQPIVQTTSDQIEPLAEPKRAETDRLAAVPEQDIRSKMTQPPTRMIRQTGSRPPQWVPGDPTAAPGEVKAGGGIPNELNHHPCSGRDCDRFRPRSIPCRRWAARAKTPVTGSVGYTLAG
jgi:hypothetical protein